MSALQAQISAKPTVYKGVTFRSKSEARFAVTLDSAGIEWVYEPQLPDAALEWSPDFYLVFPILDNSMAILLEYKPKLVTETYRDWWFDQSDKAIHADYGQSTVDACVMLVTSFFQMEDKSNQEAYWWIAVDDTPTKRGHLAYSTLVYDMVNKTLNSFMTEDNLRKARDYRFDLA